MLLRLAHLTVTNTFAALRLLPMSDRDQDAEILALRHNEHRPQQGIANARPLHVLPEPTSGPGQATRLGIRRHDRLGGTLHEYQHAA